VLRVVDQHRSDQTVWQRDVLGPMELARLAVAGDVCRGPAHNTVELMLQP
jgi:hypothetical protein